MVELYYTQQKNTRISLKNLPGFATTIRFFQEMLAQRDEWNHSVALLAPMAILGNYAEEIIKRLERGAHLNKLRHIFAAIEDEHHDYFVLL